MPTAMLPESLRDHRGQSHRHARRPGPRDCREAESQDARIRPPRPSPRATRDRRVVQGQGGRDGPVPPRHRARGVDAKPAAPGFYERYGFVAVASARGRARPRSSSSPSRGCPDGSREPAWLEGVAAAAAAGRRSPHEIAPAGAATPSAGTPIAFAVTAAAPRSDKPSLRPAAGGSRPGGSPPRLAAGSLPGRKSLLRPPRARLVRRNRCCGGRGPVPPGEHAAAACRGCRPGDDVGAAACREPAPPPPNGAAACPGLVPGGKTAPAAGRERFSRRNVAR